LQLLSQAVILKIAVQELNQSHAGSGVLIEVACHRFEQKNFVPANCPEPSLLSFHFVPLVMEPSELKITLFLEIWLEAIVQPPIVPRAKVQERPLI
jgi:hypothetical protein